MFSACCKGVRQEMNFQVCIWDENGEASAFQRMHVGALPVRVKPENMWECSLKFNIEHLLQPRLNIQRKNTAKLDFRVRGIPMGRISREILFFKNSGHQYRTKVPLSGFADFCREIPIAWSIVDCRRLLCWGSLIAIVGSFLDPAGEWSRELERWGRSSKRWERKAKFSLFIFSLLSFALSLILLSLRIL